MIFVVIIWTAGHLLPGSPFLLLYNGKIGGF